MSDNALENFHYHLIDNHTPKTIFLLHGTGGDETDLLPLVEPFLKTHTVVGLRGNVDEHGLTRFFERREDGSFVQESITEEAKKLSEFLHAFYEKFDTSANKSVFIGYSNGANMILATLFYYPELIKRAAILHGMLPFEPDSEIDLSEHAILASWGQNDFLIPSEKSVEMINTLKRHHAQLVEVTTNGGHGLMREEVEKLREFILNE